MNRAVLASSSLVLLALGACADTGLSSPGSSGSRVTVTDGVYHAPMGPTMPPWGRNPPPDAAAKAEAVPDGVHRRQHGSSPERAASTPVPPDAGLGIKTAPRAAVASQGLKPPAGAQPSAPPPGAAPARPAVPGGGIAAYDPFSASHPAAAGGDKPAPPAPAAIDTGKSRAMDRS